MPPRKVAGRGKEATEMRNRSDRHAGREGKVKSQADGKQRVIQGKHRDE